MLDPVTSLQTDQSNKYWNACVAINKSACIMGMLHLYSHVISITLFAAEMSFYTGGDN